MTLLEKIKEIYKQDRFATKVTGVELVDVGKNYAKTKMVISPDHRNVVGQVMGGAIFTVADFAFAVASNIGAPETISTDSHIVFMNAAKGDTLYAEAECLKAGRRACTFCIHVTDNLGINVAQMTMMGMRVSDKYIIDPAECHFD